jgi:predicted Rossmann fold flavoprotein
MPEPRADAPPAALPSPPAGLGAWPLAVVGAGAAGLLAAIFAGRGGVPAIVLETREKPGAKIRVSGGGRCNVLPSAVRPEDFHTDGSRPAMRNALASWPLAEVRAFFENDLGVALELEPSGKLFPRSNDPREVVAALLGATHAAGAELVGGARVLSLERHAAGFRLTTGAGELLAERVAIATGGLSLPKSGSDGAGYAFARELGLPTLPTYPALVPLTSPDARFGALAGISLQAELTAWRGGRRAASFEGEMLFTHRGFSGPVALDASHQLAAPWGAGTSLTARWLGRAAPDWQALLAGGGTRTLAAVVRERLPRRLAQLLLELARVSPERALAQLARDERRALLEVLSACPLPVSGNEGYATAEVTGGGVPLAALSTRTLEARAVPGLHFAGEVIDVTGRIGGYNFLWAWVSGRQVGRAVARARAASAG